MEAARRHRGQVERPVREGSGRPQGRRGATTTATPSPGAGQALRPGLARRRRQGRRRGREPGRQPTERWRALGPQRATRLHPPRDHRRAGASARSSTWRWCSACRCAAPRSSDLKAAARALASGLRQAQSTAMVTRRDALLTVDVDSREFVMPRRPRAAQAARGHRPQALHRAVRGGRASAAARSASIPTAAPPAGASRCPRASASTSSTWTGSRAGCRSATRARARAVGLHAARGRGGLRDALARARHVFEIFSTGHAHAPATSRPVARARDRAVAACRRRASSETFKDGDDARARATTAASAGASRVARLRRGRRPRQARAADLLSRCASRCGWPGVGHGARARARPLDAGAGQAGT